MTAEVDEATYRAWRVRKTVWYVLAQTTEHPAYTGYREMLKCRGYEVNDEDMNMTVTTFMERYGQDKDYHNQTWLSEREGESIMVFFPKSTKVGVKTCIRYLDLMKNGNVTRGIMVLPQTLSPFAKQGLLEMKVRLDDPHHLNYIFIAGLPFGVLYGRGVNVQCHET